MLPEYSEYEIITYFKSKLDLFEVFENVYLFGSVLDNNRISNDIDVLLIYSNLSNNLIEQSKIISHFFENYFKLPIDITLLSCIEKRDTMILDNIVYKQIK